MNNKIRGFTKNLIKYASVHFYDLDEKHLTKNTLKIIESIKGKTDPKLITLSNEYAEDIFGSKNYAPWLYIYSAMNATFKEGWIPENYFNKIVVPKIEGEYGKVSFLKPLAKKILNSNLFPDLAYYVNGSYYSDNYELIQDKNIIDYLFKKSDVIVFKKDNSFQGLGIHILKKSTFELKKISSLGNGVFQNYIEQHHLFKEIMPNSVATLRVLTVLEKNGNASVRACNLRFGRKDDKYVKTTSTIILPINVKSGEFFKYGYINSYYEIEKHPNTKVEFAEKKIPNFNKCIEIALLLQKSMPFVKCIGWDMIIDKNENVQLMEWNGFYPGIHFNEIHLGPCFTGLGWENLWKEIK